MKQSGGKIRIAAETLALSTWILGLILICAPAARAQSWGEVVLHSFAGTDGAGPEARLIRGSDGNFYGSTRYGGAHNDGTVFKLTPSGRLTTLYSFGSQEGDGSEPYASLIQGSDGNFYGTTELGGANRFYGTVFKLTPSGTLTTLHSFCSVGNPSAWDCTDGADPYSGVIQSPDGNFYGTTDFGGANPKGIPLGPGTVYQLTPSGGLATLYSFCSVHDPGTYNCLDGRCPYAGLIQGSGGNFYGTTNAYGPFNEGGATGTSGGTVYQLTPSGRLTTLYSFCSQGGEACTDGFDPYSGVIQGSDGNFYGTTEGGGANNRGTVFKLTPSGALTTLYSFCSVRDRRRDPCLDGEEPHSGVIQSGNGKFYGTTPQGGANSDRASDIYGGTVYQLTPSGKLTTLYSFCSHGGEACTDGNFYGTTWGGGANSDGTVFEVGASLPTPTPTATPTPTPGHIKVVPKKLTLKAAPNATASASITIENTRTGTVTVDISEPKHDPPFSETGGGCSIPIAPGDDYQVTIKYAPTSSTTSKEKSDSITVTAISNDPRQKKPITVTLKGEK